MTPTATLAPDIDAYLVERASAITSTFVFGGTAAVSDEVFARLVEILTP